jgi:hypothetical protein
MFKRKLFNEYSETAKELAKKLNESQVEKNTALRGKDKIIICHVKT